VGRGKRLRFHGPAFGRAGEEQAVAYAADRPVSSMDRFEPCAVTLVDLESIHAAGLK